MNNRSELVTYAQISEEIFGGSKSVRTLRDQHAKAPGFPKPLEGYKPHLFRRAEIRAFYGLTQADQPAPQSRD